MARPGVIRPIFLDCAPHGRVGTERAVCPWHRMRVAGPVVPRSQTDGPATRKRVGNCTSKRSARTGPPEGHRPGAGLARAHVLPTISENALVGTSGRCQTWSQLPQCIHPPAVGVAVSASGLESCPHLEHVTVTMR